MTRRACGTGRPSSARAAWSSGPQRRPSSRVPVAKLRRAVTGAARSRLGRAARRGSALLLFAEQARREASHPVGEREAGRWPASRPIRSARPRVVAFRRGAPGRDARRARRDSPPGRADAGAPFAGALDEDSVPTAFRASAAPDRGGGRTAIRSAPPAQLDRSGGGPGPRTDECSRSMSSRELGIRALWQSREGPERGLPAEAATKRAPRGRATGRARPPRGGMAGPPAQQRVEPRDRRCSCRFDRIARGP